MPLWSAPQVQSSGLARAHPTAQLAPLGLRNYPLLCRPQRLDVCCLLDQSANILPCPAPAPAEDGRVFFWELVDAQMVESFQAHADVVCSLAMHPKGECLLTSSVDGTVKVWT